MKHAIELPAYRDVQPFEVPEGVTRVTIDPDTLQLATPECPITREEVYIHGTEPAEFCELHGGHMASDAPPASWLSRVFGGDKSKASEPGQPPAPGGPTANSGSKPSPPPGEPPDEENKKGVLHRIFGIFGGKKDADKPQQETPQPQR
jgi:hypothetical protein